MTLISSSSDINQLDSGSQKISAPPVRYSHTPSAILTMHTSVPPPSLHQSSPLHWNSECKILASETSFLFAFKLSKQEKQLSLKISAHVFTHLFGVCLRNDSSEGCLHWAVFSQRLLKWTWFLSWLMSTYQDPGHSALQCPSELWQHQLSREHLCCSYSSNGCYGRSPLNVVCTHTELTKRQRKEHYISREVCILGTNLSTCLFACVTEFPN